MESLREQRGKTTSSMITIAVPPTYPIKDFMDNKVIATENVLKKGDSQDIAQVKSKSLRQLLVSTRSKSDRIAFIKLLRTIADHFASKRVPPGGALLFAGINEFEELIFEVVEPPVAVHQFFYSCGKAFEVERFLPLLEEVRGHIAFVSGEEALLYRFEGKFVRIGRIAANVAKRHRKGGQSALRFARLAEESRAAYVARVAEAIGQLEAPCFVLGSREVRQALFEKQLRAIDGGFLEFNASTIDDTKRWLAVLKGAPLDDSLLAEAAHLLATDVDRLDFDPADSANMKFFLTKDQIEQHRASPHYSTLQHFEYIGVRYY